MFLHYCRHSDVSGLFRPHNSVSPVVKATNDTFSPHVTSYYVSFEVATKHVIRINTHLLILHSGSVNLENQKLHNVYNYYYL